MIMWRLIAFILIFALFLAFIVFNLENKCDISFGFKTLSEVPVFLTAFTSFALGLLSAVPFVVGRNRKKTSGSDFIDSPPPPSVEPGEAANPVPKKRRGSKAPEANKIERDESFRLVDELMKENNVQS
jgi:uncharacterized integral membrane protein